MKFKIAIVSLIMLCVQSIFAQTKIVSGTVLDDSGVPLPGVSVLIVGTIIGNSTDFDGKYSIEAKEGDILRFSYIGMTTADRIVGPENEIHLRMVVNTDQLDEVVVVGYGSQNRSAVTGAISTVSADDITETPFARADQALQGRVPGVTAINNGSPGSQPMIRIRGLGTVNGNNPLVVVDGVVGGDMGSLNPNDIESISVLKDASTAAIYGALGANGVILVTTKKGKSGSLRLNFDTWAGIQTQNKRYNLLNTEQYIQYATDLGNLQDPAAIPLRITDPQYASYLNTDTDWQDEIFQTGVQQSYSLSASGGGENSNYMMSVGYLDQEGIVRETSYTRFNFRANSDFTLGKFKVGETISISFNDDFSFTDGGFSPIEHAIKMAPYLKVHNPNNLGGFQGPTSGLDNQDSSNPVRILEHGSRDNRGENILGSLYASYEIANGLTLKTQGGLNHFTSLFQGFTPSYIDNENDGGGQHEQLYATISKGTSKFQSVSWTNSLNYIKTFKDVHNFDVLIVAESQKDKNISFFGGSQNSITNEIEQLSLENAQLSSSSREYARQGYLARLNYDYDRKYIFAASIRKDASSRFGTDNRWGTFPSVALGWNVAKESFLEDSSISNLKLRGSWGITGNDRIGNYRYSSSLTTDYNYSFGIDEELGVGTTATGPSDPSLKWEETSMLNVGIDLGLFKNKLNITLEYFNNKSDDLLMNEPIPPSVVIHNSTVAKNIGSVETKGFEVNIGYNQNEGDFTWGFNFNIGTAENKVLNLGATEAIFGGGFENQSISRTIVDEPMFHFYGFETDGIFQTQAEIDAHATQDNVEPGDIRFKDVNGRDTEGNLTGQPDGNIDADDRTIIGNPFPDFSYGLSANAEYKAFDFNMFWSGVSGNEIYNTNIFDLQGMVRLFNSSTDVLNRWTGPGTSNTIPRAAGAGTNVAVSDRFVEDGSFLRLKNIAIGYNIPVESDAISKLRIYISGQNIITISDYSGLDPEIGFYNPDKQENDQLGIDRGNYPTPKTITFGLQMSF